MDQQPDVMEQPGSNQGGGKQGALGNSKRLAKKGVAKIKEKCTDKVLKLANIVGTVLLLLGAILRLVHLFGCSSVVAAKRMLGETAAATVAVTAAPEVAVAAAPCASNFNFFFMITTFYFWFFVIIFGLTEAKEELKARVFVVTYFNFLDSQFGKGLFLLFLTIMLCETSNAIDIIIGLVIIGIAVCNLIIGWSQDKKAATNPWDQGQSQAAADGNDRQNQYKMNDNEAGAGGVQTDFNRPSNVPFSQDQHQNVPQEDLDIEIDRGNGAQQQQPQQNPSSQNTKPSDVQIDGLDDVELEDPYKM